MGTQVSGSQINRRWALAGGLGLFITGGASVVALFVANNGAGVATHKVHSDGSVTQSGSLLAKSGSTTTFFWNTITARVGVRTQTPKTEFAVVGTLSGSALHVSRAFSGAGLSDCDTAGSSKLLWDATTGRFSCGTDAGATYTPGQGLTLASTVLSLTPSHSGTTIWATTALRSSGSLVVEGAMSGASLFLGTKLEGAGLVDCDTGATSKLLWDGTTGRFSCGTDTDTNTTYTAGQGLTLTSTSFRLNASHSGTVIWATTTLRSSGSLVVEGNMSGATLNVGGSATVGSFTALSLRNCRYLATDSNGLATCGSYPTRTVVLTAGGGLPSTRTGSGASGPEIATGTTNDTSMYVLEYGNTAKPRYAMWTATMPDNYDGGTLTFLFNWRTASTSGDVKWFIQCRSIGDDEAIDQSWGTAQSVTDTAGTANTLRTTSATAAVTCAGTPAGGEVIQFRVYRDPADGADTLANTGALISVKGEYTTNAISD